MNMFGAIFAHNKSNNLPQLLGTTFIVWYFQQLCNFFDVLNDTMSFRLNKFA